MGQSILFCERQYAMRNTHSNAQKILRYLLKPKVHCHVQSERYSEINYITTTYILKIRSNIRIIATLHIMSYVDINICEAKPHAGRW